MTRSEMRSSIALQDLAAQYRELRTEIDAAVADVLTSGWYILGSQVSAFEDEFAAYCGAAGCVGVNSGTDALQLTLWACGIGPGDEVITVAHTAVATAAAIRLTGAVPVFVDIDRPRIRWTRRALLPPSRRVPGPSCPFTSMGTRPR